LAKERFKAGNKRPIFDSSERSEIKQLIRTARFQPAVVDYLKAQLHAMDRRWKDALEALARVSDAQLLRPGLFVQTAQLYARLNRWSEAKTVYRKALTLDPDNPHAHLGICRVALRRRDFQVAVQSALDAIQRQYHHPVAHALLGVSLTGLGQFERAAGAFRVALTLNPNYPQAHLWLARLSRRWLKDKKAAGEHARMFLKLRLPPTGQSAAPCELAPEVEIPKRKRSQLPLCQELIIVSGLPRSGTSMLMQMLAAAGIPALTDGIRAADEDNPRGYFEFDPVKRLFADATWLAEAKGKAVKIVGPLLAALPPDLPCRVIWINRDLDEILHSQQKMLKNEMAAAGNHEALKAEYARSVARSLNWLAQRPYTAYLILEREAVLRDPSAAAAEIADFLDGTVSVAPMAEAVDPELNRSRRSLQ
jgi:tetratricopeptide (TPR) repeat protein